MFETLTRPIPAVRLTTYRLNYETVPNQTSSISGAQCSNRPEIVAFIVATPLEGRYPQGRCLEAPFDQSRLSIVQDCTSYLVRTFQLSAFTGEP